MPLSKTAPTEKLYGFITYLLNPIVISLSEVTFCRLDIRIDRSIAGQRIHTPLTISMYV